MKRKLTTKGKIILSISVSIGSAIATFPMIGASLTNVSYPSEVYTIQALIGILITCALIGYVLLRHTKPKSQNAQK